MTAPFDPRAFEGAAPAGAPPPLAVAELLSALRRRWTLVALAGLLAAAAAAGLLARAPERWTATAEVLLEAAAPRIAPFDAVIPTGEIDAQAVTSEMRVIQSQTLLTRVARHLRLAEDPGFGVPAPPGRLDAWRAAARGWAERALGWAPPAPPPEDTARARELRAVAFVRRLISDGRIQPGTMKDVLIHAIRDDETMRALGVATKVQADWTLMRNLKQAGRDAADAFLRAHWKDLGRRASVDLRDMFD